jgi:hypothetical protein
MWNTSNKGWAVIIALRAVPLLAHSWIGSHVKLPDAAFLRLFILESVILVVFSSFFAQ